MKNADTDLELYPTVELSFGLKEMMLANQTDLCVLIDIDLNCLIVAEDEIQLGRTDMLEDEVVFATSVDAEFPEDMPLDERMMALFLFATDIIECAKEELLINQAA